MHVMSCHAMPYPGNPTVLFLEAYVTSDSTHSNRNIQFLRRAVDQSVLLEQPKLPEVSCWCESSFWRPWTPYCSFFDGPLTLILWPTADPIPSHRRPNQSQNFHKSLGKSSDLTQTAKKMKKFLSFISIIRLIHHVSSYPGWFHCELLSKCFWIMALNVIASVCRIDCLLSPLYAAIEE